MLQHANKMEYSVMQNNGMQNNLSLDLLIVDDHKLVLSGMRSLLSDNPMVNSITEASTGEDAVALATEKKFSVILMDLDLPGMSGIEASKAILAQDKNTPIIVLSGRLENDDVRALMAAGVRGYLTKGCEAGEMEQAIKSVVAGEQHMAAEVAKHFAFDLLNGRPDNPFDQLTPREREIADELIDGKRNRRILSLIHI